MILVDTSVIVAWLDPTHPDHEKCARALDNCAAGNQLAVSSITFAELAAGSRNREALDEDLAGFVRLEFGFDSAFIAGQAFRKFRSPKKGQKPVPPDFLIRGQAAHLNLPHLTNDRSHLRTFPEIDFLFPTV